MQDTDTGPSPEESLALVEATRRQARRELLVTAAPFYYAWGIVWIVGYGGTHLIAVGPLRWPEWTINLVWVLAILAALAFTAAYIARRARGVAGASSRLGIRMSLLYMVGFAAAAIFGALVGLDDQQWGALFAFVVSLLYMATGAANLDDVQFAAGLWIGAVNLAALWAGPRWYALAMATLAAGGMIAAGWVQQWRAEVLAHADAR